MYEINKSRIGLKIKDVRESNGCSMAEFGDKLGVTKGAVNNYELKEDWVIFVLLPMMWNFQS